MSQLGIYHRVQLSPNEEARAEATARRHGYEFVGVLFVELSGGQTMRKLELRRNGRDLTARCAQADMPLEQFIAEACLQLHREAP